MEKLPSCQHFAVEPYDMWFIGIPGLGWVVVFFYLELVEELPTTTEKNRGKSRLTKMCPVVNLQRVQARNKKPTAPWN